MRRYRITHITEYTYLDRVELLPHTLRLRPREGHDLRIENSTLQITPVATLRWQRDTEGNIITIATFNEKTQCLRIYSEIVVQQYDESPLDFLVSDYAVIYPFEYDEYDQLLLAVYMNNKAAPISDLELNFIASLGAIADNTQTYSLLVTLNKAIHNTVRYQRRDIEGVQSAQQTLSKLTGSCRDMANLFIQIARAMGFAARFVSGYMHSGVSGLLYGSTHAWVEIFIPGAGWKGFDPTNNTIVGEEHIAISNASEPEKVPPVSGKFNGIPVSEMNVTVMVKELT